MRTAWLLLLLLAPGVPAHQQSTSYGAWELQGGVARFVLRISQLDLTRARLHPRQPGFEPALHDYVRAHVALGRGGVACAVANVRTEADEPGWSRVRVDWTCPVEDGPHEIRFTGLFAQAPNHVHLAAIRAADGALHSRVFTSGRETWSAAARTGTVAGGFSSFFGLGVQHILEGWDHLCFLLALVLFVGRWQTLAWLVTGFTVGHSVTLALATLGLAIPAARAVEWVIAFSILALAVENCWRQESYRGYWPYLLLGGIAVAGVAGGALPLLTAAGLCLLLFAYYAMQRQPEAPRHLGMFLTVSFGLFHGFGFAGVLGELAIPAEQLPLSLLAFNLGVEAGQLLAIVLALPLLRWVQRAHGAWLNLPNALASAAACYWLVQRTVG